LWRWFELLIKKNNYSQDTKYQHLTLFLRIKSLLVKVEKLKISYALLGKSKEKHDISSLNNIVMRFLLALTFLWGVGHFAKAQSDISIFDQKGIPQAYISNDLVIYTWDGDAAAYVHQKGGIWYVYAFSGKHLGFYRNGQVLNDKGQLLGAAKGKSTIIPARGMEEKPRGEQKAPPERQPRQAATSLSKTPGMKIVKASLRDVLYYN